MFRCSCDGLGAHGARTKSPRRCCISSTCIVINIIIINLCPRCQPFVSTRIHGASTLQHQASADIEPCMLI